jgi:uncharacterized membrane protein YeaQ/YmgE (transglycosylase-associated protein family)
MTFGEIVVWLIVGALAGTLAGRLMTFSKRGFGFWTNMVVGMVGALVGGFLFRLFHIDLGLAEIKITFEDLISAFVGSLLCIIVWRLIRRRAEEKSRIGNRGSANRLTTANLTSPGSTKLGTKPWPKAGSF